MAFNTTENPDVVQTGWLTASRGTEGNQAYGELFKGIANTVSNTLNAYDDQTRTQIQIDATQAVDQIATEGLPPGLQKDIGVLNSLKTSRDQGAMSEIEYRTKIAATAKSMRKNYPAGYSDVIEGALSSASGSSTANQLRQAALQEEAVRQEKMDAGERQRVKYLNDNEKYLMSAQGKDLYRTITGKDFDATSATFWEMQAVAGTMQARDYSRQAELAAAGADKDAAKRAVGNLGKDMIRNAMSEANPLFNQLQKQLQMAGADGKLTDEERAQLLPLWQNFRTKTLADFEVAINKSDHPGISGFTVSDRADVRANMEAELNAYDAMLQSPTPKQLELIQNANKLTDELTKNQLLKLPTLRTYNGLVSMGMKPETIDRFLDTPSANGGPPLRAQLDAELTQSFTLGIMSGQFSIPDGFKLGGADMPAPTKFAALQNLSKAMADKTISPEEAAMVAQNVFTDDFKPALDEYAKNDPMKLFRLFVNPEISSKLLSTDGPAKANYIEWANRQSLTFMRPLGKILENAQRDSELGNLKFENGRFSVNVQGAQSTLSGTMMNIPLSGAAVVEASKLQQLTSRVAEVNQYITMMEPIWKEMGFKDTSQAVIAAMNQDPSQVKKEGNWFTVLSNWMLNSLTTQDQMKGEQSATDLPGNTANDQIRSGIATAAEALGIDPVDLATAISYETAGTFNPKKKGPRTQWGQHRGLIQFGEPQAAEYGVNWDDPVNSQLGPDGAVVKYLKKAGVKPGMGLLDIYSAINAGGVGKYDATDANNGGAPGTVRDKVTKQMRAHRKKALELLGEA